MEDRLMQDFKDAMKSGNTIKKNTIQQLRASILLAKKDKPNMTDEEFEAIVMKEKNKRLEALVQFEKANRQDLVEQTNKELLYINEYLPQPMSETEIAETVKNVLETENVTEKKLMGFAIKKCKEIIGNRATGKQISDEVKKQLENMN